jgi:alpha-1,3/alpha-1,6-mannosyltransferase
VVEHEKTGLLCPPNAQSLAENLLRLLQDENLRKRLGEHGRERVQERFDLHHTFAALLACLRS